MRARVPNTPSLHRSVPLLPVTLARNAMATRFELLLHGEKAVALRAAGEEALDEVARLENQLSLYRPGSEIAQLNARAAREAVRVTPELFNLLQHAQRLHAETDGAFDITVAPLVRCWGFMGASGKLPPPEAVAAAREKVGMQHVQLSAADCTVRFARDGVMLDLGAIGKGYAVGRAAEILRDAGVTSALIHGGTSTVYAMGHPPDAESWNIAIEKSSLSPSNREREKNPGSDDEPRNESSAGMDHSFSLSLSERERAGVRVRPAFMVVASSDDWPTAIALHDEAMSVSAIWGRSFDADGKNFGHVIDPRTGQPTEAALLAAVVLASATETDALSTALLTLGRAGLDRIADLRPGARVMIVSQEAGAICLARRGFSDSGRR